MTKGFKIALIFFFIELSLFIITKIFRFINLKKIGIDLGSEKNLILSIIFIFLYLFYLKILKPQKKTK